jgi:hypothetical protein
MYAWIWRNLPGPMALRLFETFLLLLGVIALLLFVIFPVVEPHLPFNQVTVPKSK